MRVTIEWRPVPGFEGRYEVSSTGLVRSIRVPGTHLQGIVLKATATKKGTPYLAVHLIEAGGRRRRLTVHRIVALAFHGEPEPGQEVRHIDTNGLNNRAENLAWGTSAENTADTIAQGRHARYGGRTTVCPRGHEKVNPLPRNGCRVCKNERRRVGLSL